MGNAKQTFDVWQRMIQDETVYDAMRENRHREHRPPPALSEEQLAILDEFREQPGTRWAVENLRYRGTMMVVRGLQKRMPATCLLLTKGEPDWLWDLAWEYLALHHWLDLGHYRASECLRFADFVRQRVMARRHMPEGFESVLGFETARQQVMKSASEMQPDEWKPHDSSPEQVFGLSKRAVLVSLESDILDWTLAPSGPVQVASAEPVDVLLLIPSREQEMEVRRLSTAEGQALRSLTTKHSLQQVLDGLQDDEEGDSLRNKLLTWTKEGVFVG